MLLGKLEMKTMPSMTSKKKQYYYIDFYMNRYTTAGYGQVSTNVKETVIKMMDLLKNDKTQKDVIQHLISQTEYDF